MSVYIDSVSIAGIMGIPNEISLDLSAPLTLIYAPNGTGKTSTWTAVRALMAKGITDDIACQFPGSSVPKVFGKFLIRGSRYTATAEVGKLSLVDELGNVLNGTSALTRLAPEVNITGVQTKGGVLKDRLASQIDGCRFLPSESLLYLINSDAASTELRRKLFADLTGTSAIQAEARETSRYRDMLSSELSNIEHNLHTIDAQLQAFSVNHNPSSSDPLHLIEQAKSIAAIRGSATMSAQRALSLIREHLTNGTAAVDIGQTALSTWCSIDATYPHLDSDVDASREKVDTANIAQDVHRQTLLRLQSDEIMGARKRTQREHEKLQRGLSRISRLIVTEGRTGLLMGSSLAQLRRSLRPFDSEYDIESRLGVLEQLDSSRDRYRTLLAEQQEALERRSVATAQLAVPLRDVQASLVQKTAERSDLANRISRQSDSIASLRTLAENLVTTSRSSICPCCSHHWGTTERLLAAISTGIDFEQNHTRLKRDLDALDQSISQLQLEHINAKVAEDSRRSLDALLSDLSASIGEIEQLSSLHGVSLARLRETNGTIEEVLQLRSLLSIWRILEALDSLGCDFDEQDTIDACLAILSSRSDVLKDTAADAAKAEEAQEQLIQREQRALASSVDHARQSENKLMNLVRVKQQRDTAIEYLHSQGLLNTSQAQEALSEEFNKLEKLKILVSQISSAMEASAAIQAREQIESNREALSKRKEKVLTEAQLADRLIHLLTELETHAGQRFFDQLGPAVATLFDHMQVNRVFRSLEIRAVKESFCLDGQLDDNVSLDPRAHFSQGQRQDLALSMFLVRAASLGGSFFLDEPLVHLDDLNRTALLDCLRACVLGTLGSAMPVRLVVTTANWSVARHLMQKFYSVKHTSAQPLLRVIQLSGNVRSQVHQSLVFPTATQSLDANYH